MTNKELRMLSKLDLLEVLAHQERENERLRARIAELEELLGQGVSGDGETAEAGVESVAAAADAENSEAGADAAEGGAVENGATDESAAENGAMSGDVKAETVVADEIPGESEAEEVGHAAHAEASEEGVNEEASAESEIKGFAAEIKKHDSVTENSGDRHEKRSRKKHSFFERF